ncbi:MAG TPA: hypothetical protein VFS60_19145, partial [Thermoanaerobaculia bacterium]|nr:hypothetical protein [Thermoanaerobaculia bacterium]
MSPPYRQPAHALSLALLLAIGLARTTAAAPLRTPSPGTGVYHGLAVNGRFTLGEERSGDGHQLAEAIATAEVRYTPATSWSFSVTVPRVERTAKGSDGSETRLSGLGDIKLTGRYRFFRQLGRWRDRQAAVGFGVELPTGERR